MDGIAIVSRAAGQPGDAPSGPRRRGLWVAFLGADGCGKSSVIQCLERDLGGVWNGVRRFHLRPHFGLKDPDGPPVTDPHGSSPRGLPTTLIKLALWWLDGTLGYLVAVRRELKRGRLVVFDRFVLDLVVDPRRYRFARPRWLADVLVRSIPEPDVYFVMDAPPDVLQSRKQEVERDELVRQRSAYRDLAARLPNAVLVDASRPLEEVVEEVEERILAAEPGG